MAKITDIDITSLLWQEGSAPSTPASTKWRLYFKTDGLYHKDDAGSEVGPIGGGTSIVTGIAPFSYPLNHSHTAAFSTSINLAANGGSLAVPMLVAAPMALTRCVIYQLSTSTARAWRWDLYKDANTSNTLNRVAASNGSESFTPSAAGNRILDVTSGPVSLNPGVYWLVIQNTHATNQFQLASTAMGTNLAIFNAQTKTTTNPNGATLDFVAATWTKQTSLIACVMQGDVFGTAAEF